MDEKTRNEISELILKVLLEEILRDGRIDPREKQVFQKLFKALKIDKSRAAGIHQEVLTHTRRKEREGALDLKVFFTRLKGELESVPHASQMSRGILQRVSKILEFDLATLEESQPPVEDSPPSRMEDEEESPEEVLQDLAQIASEHERGYYEGNDQGDGQSSWKQDWLKGFLDHFSGGAKKVVQKILELRNSGAHLEAQKALQDYSIPIEYEQRYLLLARIYAELDRVEEAQENLEKARKSGLDAGLYQYEKFFIESRFSEPSEALGRWLDLNSCKDQGTEQKQEGLRELCRSWEGRYQRVLSTHYLEICAEDQESFRLLDHFREEVFEDIYFRYYGRAIMLIQLLASLLVLSICFYNIGYIGPAVNGILVGIVSGIPDPQTFLGHLGVVFPFSFLVIALFPVAYINGLMLYASFQNHVLSYTENYSSFIKVCNFGRVHHLSKDDHSKPLFLYQDDNDYTYISLVRHLPFVPNFTYIYGFDKLRGFHCLLPLYGVADGFLFAKKHLTGAAGYSFPINMLGVRLAQAATAVSFISSSILFSIPLILLAVGFFATYISYAAEASVESYAVSFSVFLVSIALFYSTPWATMKFLTTKFINLPLTVNIIKPGLLFLAGAYLFGHYSVYSYTGILPATCMLVIFYLLFVKTKYPPEKKQVVAQVSSLDHLSGTNEPLTELPGGLKALYLGRENSRYRNRIHLFFNKEFVVLTRKLMGLTLYYDVINFTSGFKIWLMEIPGGSRLRISTYNFDIATGPQELKAICESAGMPVEIARITEPNRSKIPLNQLIGLGSIWLLWQLAITFTHPGYTPRKLPPSKEYLYNAAEYLRSYKDGFRHKEEGVYYERVIIPEREEIIFWHRNKITWEEFEEAVRAKSDSARQVQSRTSTLSSAEFILPSFIKKDGFRDDVIEFLGWQFLTRWQSVDPLRYGKELEIYCQNFGSAAIKRSKDLVCAFPFQYKHAVEWIFETRSVPEIFDIEILRELSGLNGEILEFAPAMARLDRATLERSIAQDGMLLQYAAPELRRDKKIVLAALNNDYKAYQFMDPGFFSDITVVSKLIEKDGMLLELASKALQKNRGLVLKAIRQNHSAHKFMDDQLWKDREICKNLLSKDGMLLQYVDPALQKTDRLVKIAIMENGKAIQFAADRFRKDRAVVSTALQNDPSAWIYMDPSLFEHRDLAIQVLKRDGLQLEKLSEKFRKDPDVVLVAIHENFRAYLSMDSSLWKNRRVVSSILKKQGLAFEFVDTKLRGDRDLVALALVQNGLALEFFPEKFHGDKELVLTAVRSNGLALKFAPQEFRDDLEILIEAAKQNLESLKYGFLSKEWMEKESEKDNPIAQICLGYYHQEGIRYPKDETRARNLLKRAAERGIALAQRTLAQSYLKNPNGRGDLDRAWKWLEAAADQGDLESITRIGELHEEGLAVFKDDSKALEWYLKASDRGYPRAQFLLGKILDRNPALKIQGKDSAFWYSRAGESGYLPAQVILGQRFYLGQNSKPNYSKSFSWFAQSGRQGDLGSQVYLGVLYGWGLGVEPSWKTARSWFVKAKEQGLEFTECFISADSPKNPGPQPGEELRKWMFRQAKEGVSEFLCATGVMYEKGEWDVSADPEKAFEHFQRSSELGNHAAQNRLGKAYLEGIGTQRNPSKAFHWFQKAAESGYPPAQTSIGAAFEKGSGIGKNEEKAVEWYKKAASQGYPPAQLALGILFELGRGINRDYQKAVHWYERAAQQGNANAQANLGIMYEFGKGVSKNEEKAVEWYGKAAAQDNPRALRNLKFMKDRGVAVPEEF